MGKHWKFCDTSYKCKIVFSFSYFVSKISASRSQLKIISTPSMKVPVRRMSIKIWCHSAMHFFETCSISAPYTSTCTPDGPHHTAHYTQSRNKHFRTMHIHITDKSSMTFWVNPDQMSVYFIQFEVQSEYKFEVISHPDPKPNRTTEAYKIPAAYHEYHLIHGQIAAND